MSWSRLKSGGNPEPLRLSQILHVSVLGLVHDDLGSSVLKDTQPTGVVCVQMALHDVPEVVRS